MNVPSVLNCLPPKVISSLLQTYPVTHLQTGEAVHRRGEPADRVWMVLKGSVQGNRNGDKKVARILCQSNAGETLGLCCALNAKQYMCEGVALGPTELLAIPLPEFLGLLERHQAFREAVMSETSRRIKGSISYTMENRGTVDSRLRAAVRRLIAQQGHEIHATRRELAVMAGTTVESAIRTVRKWEKLGWVSTFWKGIQIIKARPFLARRVPQAVSRAAKRKVA